MSKWTDFRDSIVDSLNIEEITESTKSNLTRWLLETILPLAKAYGEKFIAEIQAQAASETGWCKARDMIVLPFVINGGLWLVEKVLAKTVEETA